MVKKYLSELELAEEFIQIAGDNLKSSLRTSANRVYFALEKAIIAFLLFKNIGVPKNHQKIWELSSEFLGEEYYQNLRELYDLRMQADYGVVSIIIDFNEEIVKEKIDIVRNLIRGIKRKLKRVSNDK